MIDGLQPCEVKAGLRTRSALECSLAAVCTLEEERYTLIRQRPAALSVEKRERLLRMGHDLAAAWHYLSATAVTRKHIIHTTRVAVCEPHFLLASFCRPRQAAFDVRQENFEGNNEKFVTAQVILLEGALTGHG